MAQNSKVEPHVLKRFDLLKKVGSGAYGHVWKVQDRMTKQTLALKKIFDAFQHSTDAQRTYRQISILRQLDHDNIIKLRETIKAQNGKDIYLVFEYMEADLHNVISEGILKPVHNKYIIYQIAKALKYLHTGKLIHRDLKPSNVLLNSNCLVKLCDFGLVRCLTADQENNNVMTEGVATRWYRAPQVLLGSRSYEYAADVWSFGCIIFEIYFRRPLFNGGSTLEQLQKIIEFIGYPDLVDINSLDSDLAKTMISETKLQHQAIGEIHKVIKQLDEDVQDMIRGIIKFNPKKRYTIQEILAHPLLKDFRRIDQEKSCQHQIKTDLDDNRKMGVENYRNILYGQAKSEPKREASSKKKPTSANTSVVNKSDKKNTSGNLLANCKSSENINKPSSALMQQKSATNILKNNKSAENVTKPELVSKASPKMSTTITKPELPITAATKPVHTKVSSPTNTMTGSPTNVSMTQFQSTKTNNLSSVQSGKLIKTILRKPEKENLVVGLTKTLNISQTMSPKAILARKPLPK